MSVQDVIKKSILELDNFSGTFTVSAVVSMSIALLVALLFGLFICFMYDRFYRGVVYSKAFAMTLVGMTVLTTMITLAISTNIVISLGMIGALSIVRYRTAIKEPADLLYLFWTIATGISAGARMYPLCVIASILMVIVIIAFNRGEKGRQLYIMVVHYTGLVGSDMIRKAMGSLKYRVKSRTMRGEYSEMALEIVIPNNNTAFLEKVRAIEGVEDVTLIQYDGEYHGK